MSDDREAPGARQSKRGPDCYISGLREKAYTPFALALQELFPPGTAHARLTAFFGHRVARDTVRNWRYGRSNPPQWAIDMLADYGARITQQARQTKAGNHQEAGQRALDLYRKKRRALGG